MFYGPCCGIQLCEYFIIRRRHIKLEDLYVGGPDSIYWFWHGFNPRSHVSFLLALVPTLPGFIMVVRGVRPDTDPWVRMYHLGFLLGLVTAFVVHLIICTIFPPPHRFEGVTEHIDIDLGSDLEISNTHPTEIESKEGVYISTAAI